jgi:hypothetical protein
MVGDKLMRNGMTAREFVNRPSFLARIEMRLEQTYGAAE